ncbi:MAG: Ubiquinone biosynthesis O-methyltransferase [Phycisphaerae bacterium]|nr:Ubiquinone biosynthesis O-methyltransferase [Phycisphaerae bacterium]
MSDHRCRVCGETQLTPVLHYDRAPSNIERLLEADQFDRDRAVELNVVRCGWCGHVQLPVTLQDDYYEDYLMSHSHARKMQDFQRRQARAFLQHFQLDGARIFEAGCGDGQFSLILQEMGCEVVANEPSQKALRACQAKGLNAVGGYVGRGTFPELHGTFDAVVSRQVMEHVPDPNDFLQGLRQLLKPHGAGLIEIPALEQALEHRRFFDFFPDHLSYFSQPVLNYLFARNQYEVVQLQRAMDGEYNEVWFRRAEPVSLAEVQQAADTISRNFDLFLTAEGRAHRRVAIWGAGAKGVLTLALVNSSAVAYLVDLDPVKHNRYTPVSHLQVHSPERLRHEPVDTVIITALAYKDEITRQLREQFQFAGKIMVLSGGELLEVPAEQLAGTAG